MVPKMQERDLAEGMDICFLLYWIGSPTSRSPLTGGWLPTAQSRVGLWVRGTDFLLICLLICWKSVQAYHPWGSADPQAASGGDKERPRKATLPRIIRRVHALHLFSQLSVFLLIESDFSFLLEAGLTSVQARLDWNILCSSGWPQTHSNSPASNSHVAGV